MGFLVGDISAGLGSLKAMKDIVQGLSAAKTEAAINTVKIDLQNHILDAQEALLKSQEIKSAAARRIDELEQEIVGLKDWSAEQERYELKNVWRGAMAYMLKPDVRGSEPPHWLCANCFNQHRKSFMLFKGQAGGNSSYGCDGCKSTMIVDYRTRPSYEEGA